jgi:RNA polymerase sigma-70 factor (ECF subfamily)
LADHAAAEELFNASYPRLAGWVRRLVDDDETAHEIASEAFTRLLARWSGLESPHSYLYMSATNLVRDHWRRPAGSARRSRPDRGAPRDPSYHPAQDVDVRTLIEGCQERLQARSCCTTTAGSGYGRWRPCSASRGTIKADLYHARSKLKSAMEAPVTTRTTTSSIAG